jgi:hypothetical protein
MAGGWEVSCEREQLGIEVTLSCTPPQALSLDKTGTIINDTLTWTGPFDFNGWRYVGRQPTRKRLWMEAKHARALKIPGQSCTIYYIYFAVMPSPAGILLPSAIFHPLNNLLHGGADNPLQFFIN